jgi:hypothetical protein
VVIAYYNNRISPGRSDIAAQDRPLAAALTEVDSRGSASGLPTRARFGGTAAPALLRQTKVGVPSMQERTTASSPARLNGLVMRWLAPASRALSTSSSLDTAENMITGR